MVNVESEMTRKNPLQFSVLTCILVLLIVACGLGGWRYSYVRRIRPITTEQSQRIKSGMSKTQVIEILGSPHRVWYDSRWWGYSFSETPVFEESYLEVIFDTNGKVVRSGFGPFFPNDDPAKTEAQLSE